MSFTFETPPVHFNNGHWLVTNDGMECLSYPISVPAADLIALQDGQDYYALPLYVSDKRGVRLETFRPAYEAALEHHFPGDWNPLKVSKAMDVAADFLAERQAAATD